MNCIYKLSDLNFAGTGCPILQRLCTCICGRIPSLFFPNGFLGFSYQAETPQISASPSQAYARFALSNINYCVLSWKAVWVSVTKCIFILLKLSCSLLFPKWLVCQGTLFRLCLGCLGDAFHASVAVKSALRLPPSFWHCLCLAILFICLNLVRSSPCGAGEIRKALPILLSYLMVVG